MQIPIRYESEFMEFAEFDSQLLVSNWESSLEGL